MMENNKIPWPNAFAHFLFSTTIIFGTQLFWPANAFALNIAIWSVIVFAGIKEFIDWKTDKQSLLGEAGALFDFIEFLIGLIVGIFVVGIASHFTH